MRLNEPVEFSYISGDRNILGKEIRWIAKPENKYARKNEKFPGHEVGFHQMKLEIIYQEYSNVAKRLLLCGRYDLL
jgi:hypothetical protein